MSNPGSPGFEGNDVEPFELLERVMSLKNTTLFHSVPAEKLMGLAEITRSMSYKKGTLISREGEVSDHLYIVRKGGLKIVKSKNNIKTILTILHEGETYGEIGLFNQAPRSASAIADEDCELWVIQRSSLKKFLLEMPEIAYNFLEIFSEKLRKNSEEVAQLHTSFTNSKKDYLL
jgi:CRP-like cAMP-binding protein